MKEKDVHYGELLKEMVKSKGFSAKDLSLKIGITTQGVYNIYRTKSPRIDVMIEVTRAIGLEFSTYELIQNVKQIKNNATDTSKAIDKKFNSQTQDIADKLGDRDYFTEIIIRLEKKLDTIEACLINAREVIEAKNELIKYLKEHQESVS